ncbi:MAG: PAS domain S-box protein [Deltaproteobacteria bacterium]|nr:PAS domain S-box protein [Deltaproteobacteria bacterium]
MRRLATLGTRTQLLLLAALVALPTLGILLGSSLRLRQEALARARVQAQRLADTLAAEHETVAAAAQQLTLVLAQVDGIRAGDPSIRLMLAELVRLNRAFLDVLVADRGGLVWAQAAGIEGQPVGETRWFRRALAGGRFAAGEYAVSRATGRPTIHFAAPYHDADGGVAGVLAVALALDAYRSILERTPLPAQSSYLLVDHRGTIVARSADADRWVGRPFTPRTFTGMVAGPDSGTSIGMTMVGDERVVAWRKLRLPGEEVPYLYVRVGIPVAAVLADANRELVRNLALWAALLALALSLVVWAGKRWIVDRLALLEAASARMAAGDLASRVGEQVQGGELGRLATSFDRMAAELQAREQALAQSERGYRDVLDGTVDAIFVHDAVTGRILDVNRGVERLFGHTREALLQGTVESLSTGEPGFGQEEALANIRRAAAGEAQLVEWRSRRKGGEPFWSEVRLSAATIGGTLRVLATVHDITARKAAEAEARGLQAQLLQAQKMELVGRLAGGVAHDINNMLSVVLGEAELLRAELPPGHPGQAALAQIAAAGTRSRDITRQLLAFSRRQVVAPRRLSPAEHLAGSRSTLVRLIGSDVRLTFAVPADTWPVVVDPSQLDQVLMNLVVNARDAMPRGGNLRIETGNVVVEPGPALRPDRQAGEYVRISVIDDGAGMDAETLAHVFEPFFTTKGEGRGTGLGLATVYGIVSQAGGFLDVESAPDRGSAFHVHLPRSAGPVEPPAEEGARARPGTGTVLLVEDDPAVRQTATRMLAVLGYEVLAASTPEEALALCREPSRRIDLLLSDVVMPGMRGPELRERVELLRPGLPTVFMSGHAADGVLPPGPGSGRVCFLQKPFTGSDLSARLREALG